MRVIPVTYVALLLIYIVSDGKAYYLGIRYPLLLGLGAVPAAAWTLRSHGRALLLAAAIGVSAVVSGFIALPLLPDRSLQGSVVIAINPDQGETVGWPQFIDAIAVAWRRIPTRERTHTAIFTANYGEAGAIDLLGGKRSLPRAYSGHNGFSEWGEPVGSKTHVVLVGFDAPKRRHDLLPPVT